MMDLPKWGSRYTIRTLSIDDGLTLYDKTTNEAYEDFIQFEDRGDIGNEYIYFQPKGTEPIYAELKSHEILETMLVMPKSCLSMT